MSTIEQQPPVAGSPIIPRQRTDRKGGVLAGWLSSTDHKVIGYMYLITSFGFFIIAGIMAIIIRLQLFEPNNTIVSDQVYNWLVGRYEPGLVYIGFALLGLIGLACIFLIYRTVRAILPAEKPAAA